MMLLNQSLKVSDLCLEDHLILSKLVLEVIGHPILSKRESGSISPVHPFLAPSFPAHLNPEQDQVSEGSAVLVGYT